MPVNHCFLVLQTKVNCTTSSLGTKERVYRSISNTYVTTFCIKSMIGSNCFKTNGLNVPKVCLQKTKIKTHKNIRLKHLKQHFHKVKLLQNSTKSCEKFWLNILRKHLHSQCYHSPLTFSSRTSDHHQLKKSTTKAGSKQTLIHS